MKGVMSGVTVFRKDPSKKKHGKEHFRLNYNDIEKMQKKQINKRRARKKISAASKRKNRK